MLELCSPPAPQSSPFRKPDTFFSHVHTFRACLLLVQDLSLQEHVTDAGPPVQEEYSRGGQIDHESRLVTGWEKAAGRAICGFTDALLLPSR